MSVLAAAYAVYFLVMGFCAVGALWIAIWAWRENHR